MNTDEIDKLKEIRNNVLKDMGLPPIGDMTWQREFSDKWYNEWEDTMALNVSFALTLGEVANNIFEWQKYAVSCSKEMERLRLLCEANGIDWHKKKGD